jgi:hypothetical protein
MESLSLVKVQAMLRSLERLHNAESLAEFAPAVFSALTEIIEGAFFSLDTFNLKTGEVVSATSDNIPISSEIKSRIVELVPTNPVMPIARAGVKGAIRITDCITQRQFEQTTLYLDVFVPLGIRHQAVVTLGKQDGVIAAILKISVRTVHQHIARILRKLQSETRGSAGYEAMMKLKGLESHPHAA